MKLRRLSLHGFKSFADRTELRFHDGITAIVGPNGCGKSNISDAVRWVLGEQRASAIRSSRMDEAIFQGTAGRRPLNRAEVELAFTNEDRRIPLPYDEVAIRRVVFREGGSDYELNRGACRLRDILDAFRDTGLGANAYSIIEQGMVDAMLSERTEDRRHLFEEAAGIGRYKDRRSAAVRRLEAAATDLDRLDDIIAEVDSKVRALARQRKKAERYGELRTRRLAVEITIALADLGDLRAELDEVAARLETLGSEDPAGRAALTTAEAGLEQRRIAANESARLRNAAATQLEESNRRIAERERELAVADERQSHAERRLEQIGAERADLLARRSTLEEEAATLRAEQVAQRDEAERLAAELLAVQQRLSERREALVDARRQDERLRAQEEELSRRLARVQAEAAGAEARATDLQRRLERIDREREELEGELQRLDEQGDLFASRAREIASTMTDIEAQRDQLAGRLQELRQREIEARRDVVEAEDRANLLGARLASLESLDREFHGFAPAVAATLAQRARLEGLVGAVAEVLELERQRAAEVESALNSVLQVLVVRDEDAAASLRHWLAQSENGEGSVALLRLSSLPKLQELLKELEFAGRAADEPVLVGRRARIAALRAEVETGSRDADQRRAERANVFAQLEAVEGELRQVEERLRELDLELRRAHADETARAGRQQQAVRTHGELESQKGSVVDGAERVRRESRQAVEEAERLSAAVEVKREERRSMARLVAEREAAWDAVREQEAEARVLHARSESSLATIERRLGAAEEGVAHALQRLEALTAEEREHRAALEQIAELRLDAGAALEHLFGTRDQLAADLRDLDERAERERGEIEQLEAEVRRLRRSVDAIGEERHRLELRRAEGEAQQRSVRERIEIEWGRGFDDLVQHTALAEGELEALRAELHTLTTDLERLGPVNLLAIEEYEEERQRLAFLTAQRDDLLQAKQELETAIREINRTAKELFEGTFEQIRQNFHVTFGTLFEGGECDLWLADPSDPLESPIEVSASPRGKRTQRITQLSGGERALTALALLFAIYLVKPSPFCVLDEVDAPLDEANIDRFLAMLQRFKAETQFVVITHNPRTMEAADWIYGVTMEEAGISSIVGVQIEDAVGAT
ncbi:MAG: AAA family ATPase [Longimicrobiales bacterium]